MARPGVGGGCWGCWVLGSFLPSFHSAVRPMSQPASVCTQALEAS